METVESGTYEEMLALGKVGAFVVTSPSSRKGVYTAGAGEQLAAPVNPNPLAVALGVQFEPYPAMAAVAATAPATQALFGTAVHATVGSVIAGIKFRNAVAAAGTLPTLARFGLADASGKILAISGDVKALANWPTGVCPMPFSAPFTLAYTGVYFACFVVNGTWGSTQPTPLTSSVAAATSRVADGSNPPLTFQLAGQTDLPAVGSSVTPLNGSLLGYWLALY